MGKSLITDKTNPASSTFILMSYNILAQELLTNHSYLYKTHKPKALLWETRWKNLLYEIRIIQPDVKYISFVGKFIIICTSSRSYVYKKFKNPI